MKPKEIRELNQEELQAKLRALKEELFRLRFQLATAQLENPMRVRQVRKDIARVHTVIRERELRQDAK
ncbi:MAG: 50S ribosomal protein L29 [Firmicutes bacterium]|jgi:large subunit ribosomal protein L29|uniref:Large ribosomal subunit protein uL29 n=1 Tax=Sulfobacillus benefaciens TaxID=453960 RepID=A0A2T2X7S7_9FIRM|nr:50S ribosomal protein L29 [Bacillota bacterium]PSR30539.1 MAG: 50S ribosomal protein L29 [Sulfobacillus benefaciens]HBQ94149.1 50S ribosomal protein L29 [Sulfobacillus sp.]